tara:strand:+ start:17976 stop:18407 length:432 start_codon:yes stop_codon:yes gene_type:complete
MLRTAPFALALVLSALVPAGCRKAMDHDHDHDADATVTDDGPPHGGKYGELGTEGLAEFLKDKETGDLNIWVYGTSYDEPRAASAAPYLEITTDGETRKWTAVAVEGELGAYRVPADEIEGVHLDGALTVELESAWEVTLHVH